MNNKKKSIKLAIDRDTFFHQFEIVNHQENESESNQLMLVPKMVVNHLLNDLWICEEFQGKMIQCVVLKDNLSYEEIDRILSIFEGVNDSATIEFNVKLKNVLLSLNSTIIFNMNSFDFVSEHLKISTSSSEEFIKNRINSLLQNKSSKIESVNEDIKLKINLCSLKDSAQFTEILFCPIYEIKDSSVKEASETEIYSDVDLGQNGRTLILPFEFSICLFVNNSYDFDYSLFQQEFYFPLLLLYKEVYVLSKSNTSIRENYIKIIINFIAKPKLIFSNSIQFIELAIKKLLSTLIFVQFKEKQLGISFFPKSISNLFFDVLPSLELPIASLVLNKLLLNRIFLFELCQNSEKDFKLFFELLSISIKKYKKIREIMNWQQLLDNFLFFLGISDFSDDLNQIQPHFVMASYLSSIIMLFFPFKMCENECLVLFFQDLRLKNYFVPLHRVFFPDTIDFENSSEWKKDDNKNVIELFHELNPLSKQQNETQVNLRVMMNQLTSPLLIKSVEKTSLLLDLLFLLIENHSNSEFKNEFMDSFLTLIYDYKNNNCVILVRTIALFLKCGYSFDKIPVSFFDLKKFKPRSNSQHLETNLVNFIQDSSYTLISCPILVEYLFSLYFENYSLSGFFDHEKLLISDPSILSFFLSLMRYFDIVSLEKSLQIFGIMLKHIKNRLNAFSHFNQEKILIALIDILYKFSDMKGDPFRLKLQMFNFMRDTQGKNFNLSKIEILKSKNIHELILKLEMHSLDWEKFTNYEFIKKNAVSDLSYRVIDLITSTFLNDYKDPVSVAYNALISSFYFRKLKNWDLFLQIELKYLTSFEEFCINSPNEPFEKLNICFYIHYLVLDQIDLTFFETSNFVHELFFDAFLLIRRAYSLFENLYFDQIDISSTDFLFKKNKLKLISNDKRFPVYDSESLLSFSEFSFLHFFPEENDLKKQKKNNEGKEIYLENIFFFSSLLVKTVSKSNSIVKSVKSNSSSYSFESILKINRHVLLSLLLLSKQLQILLIFSRHSQFIKKKPKFNKNFEKCILSTFICLSETLNLVGTKI